MDMYHPGHSDGNYRTAGQVQVIDPPRANSWLTGTEHRDGHLSFGGWFWRYDLAPPGPSETEVTLTYDWSAVPPDIREYFQFPPFGSEHLINSLHHLAELAAPAPRPPRLTARACPVDHETATADHEAGHIAPQALPGRHHQPHLPSA